MSLSHRKTGTRLYRIWKTMRCRCNNPHSKSYMNYGARGIKICDEWNDFQRFYEWSIANGYTETLTIERKDVDRGYSPDNCEWIPRVEQARNRRNTIKLTYKGSVVTPLELSAITGISVNTIYDTHRNRHLNDFTNYKPRIMHYSNVR